MIDNKNPWSTRENSYKQALDYLTGRLRGKITSLKTPWKKLNEVGIDGWEWHSAVAFFGRSGEGKSVLVEQLTKNVFKLNPGLKMRILKFELEMLPQVTAIREFSSEIGKSYAYMCNAEKDENLKNVSLDELKKCWDYVQRKTKKTETGEQEFPEDIIEISPSVEEFEKLIDQYMEAYCTKENDEKIYTKTLITIDHLRLFRKDGYGSELDMLYAACLLINKLKKKYPVIFVILNHLNRDVDKSDRAENGTYGNYLRDSDVFGADALLQNADIVVGMHRPARKQITKYGPSCYIIDDEYVIVMHYFKVRNGVPGMSFFRGEFYKMQIIEIDTPPKAQQKPKTYQSKDEGRSDRGTQTAAAL